MGSEKIKEYLAMADKPIFGIAAKVLHGLTTILGNITAPLDPMKRKEMYYIGKSKHGDKALLLANDLINIAVSQNKKEGDIIQLKRILSKLTEKREVIRMQKRIIVLTNSKKHQWRKFNKLRTVYLDLLVRE